MRAGARAASARAAATAGASVHYLFAARAAGRRSLVVECAGPASPRPLLCCIVSSLSRVLQVTIMSDRDRSSPSLTDTPLKTYIGRHDDDYPLINGNGECQVDNWRVRRAGGARRDRYSASACGAVTRSGARRH